MRCCRPRDGLYDLVFARKAFLTSKGKIVASFCAGNACTITIGLEVQHGGNHESPESVVYKFPEACPNDLESSIAQLISGDYFVESCQSLLLGIAMLLDYLVHNADRQNVLSQSSHNVQRFSRVSDHALRDLEEFVWHVKDVSGDERLLKGVAIIHVDECLGAGRVTRQQKVRTVVLVHQKRQSAQIGVIHAGADVFCLQVYGFTKHRHCCCIIVWER